MKKVFCFSVSLLCLTFVSAQTDAGVIIHPVLSTDSIFESSFITSLPSGESIVGMNIKESSTDYRISVVKIDSSGNQSTLVNISVPDSLGANLKIKGISCSPNGDYTCFLSNYVNNFLIKFSAANSIIWQKKIESPEATAEYYYNNTFIETPTGEYYITISDWHFLGVIKVDGNGNLLWSKKMIGPITAEGSGFYLDKSPGFCSEITANGGCISTLKDDSYQCVVNLDSNGNVVWSKSFYDDPMTYRKPYIIKKDLNGDYLILGLFANMSIDASTYIQKIDEAGNILFSKYFNNTPFLQYSFTDLMVLPDNEVVLIEANSPNGLVKLDSNLNVIWSKTINSTTFSNNLYTSRRFTSKPRGNISFMSNINANTPVFFNFSDPTEICNTVNFPLVTLSNDNLLLNATIDTNLTISTLISNMSNSSFSVSSTNYHSSDNFCFFSSVNQIAVVANLNIYPNPATDFVNIELGNLKNIDLQNAVLMIYDITGKKVYEKQLNNSSMDKISTADYAAGLYTIIITNSNTILAKQRVIVQK